METLYWHDSAAIDALAKIVQQGDVIIGSSDTVFGFLADISQKGFTTLNAIKQRNDKPYIILIGSIDKVSFFVENSTTTIECLMNRCWPGPLTIIMKAKKNLPDYLIGADGTIALRIPNHQGLLNLLQSFQGLFSTSANRAGYPAPTSLKEIDRQIMRSVSYIITDIRENNVARPSTIIDCSGPTINIVREGAYSITQINNIIKSCSE